MVRVVGNSVVSMMGFCFRFAWDNPIISFQLLCVGLLTMLYPQFCFRVFLSPTVVYTVFFLTVLLSIGERQQKEKVAALEGEKESIDEVSHLRRLQETTVGISSKDCVEYAEERIISEIVQEEEFNDGFVDGIVQEEEFNDGFVDGKEITNREAETEVYGKGSLNLVNEQVLAPDFRRDQSYTKSVHFSDSLIEGVYRSQLDVIMEVDNEEEEQSQTEVLTPRKIDTDSEDEAPMSVSPRSENKEDRHQRNVRLQDFFSLTLQCESAWKRFGHGSASASNNSCTSDDDDDGSDSSGSSEDSMGQLGPLLYEVHDPKQSHSIRSNLLPEDPSLGSNGGGEESSVDFHFTWTEEDEGDEKESLFEIVHAGDAQSMSEEDNLIEIDISDQESPEGTKNQQNTERKLLKVHGHQEEGKFEGAEEENLIEIDLSAHNIELTEEIEEKIQVQRELSDHFADDLSVQKDPTPQTESKLEEEIKASEQNESPATEPEPTGKNHEETHPPEAEIGQAKEFSVESSKQGLDPEEI